MSVVKISFFDFLGRENKQKLYFTTGVTHYTHECSVTHCLDLGSLRRTYKHRLYFRRHTHECNVTQRLISSGRANQHRLFFSF